jgi:hypothetical protein
MARRRKLGFSFSWKRASGLSSAKARLSRKTGMPLSRSGRRQKAGRLLGCCVPLIVGTAVALGIAFSAASLFAESPPSDPFRVAEDCNTGRCFQ